MKIKEIRELSIEELKNKCLQMKQELASLRIQKRTGQLESPARVKNVRKDIARMLTIISERTKQANDKNNK